MDKRKRLGGGAPVAPFRKVDQLFAIGGGTMGKIRETPLFFR